MKPNRKRLVPVGLISLVSLVLLSAGGSGSCDFKPLHVFGRNCSALFMDLTIGGPADLILNCGIVVNDMLDRDPLIILPGEDATFEQLPPELSGKIVPQPLSLLSTNARGFEMTALGSARPGNVTFGLHIFPAGQKNSPLALNYTVTVTVSTPPPPPPPPATVTVAATPNSVGTGGSTTLSATIMGGVGPFTYSWRGYRDDGDTGSFSLSSAVAASPQATVFQPDYSYYFFVTVTDTGPFRPTTATGYVRVYETDGPFARVVISPASIKVNVTTVSFDGTSSTNAGGPITGWSIDYGGATVPISLERMLLLPWASTGNVCGGASGVPCASESLTLSYGPFANPGIYRVQLTSMDVSFNTETSTEYFVVSP